MTLFSLSFLFMFMTWLHFNLDAHIKTIKSKEKLVEINRRIDLEEVVFTQVRKGIQSGEIHNQVTFEVIEDTLFINSIGTEPSSHEYDIIGDGSFEWRKKYDSIE